ncbi:excinuclease ABC subunit UvrA [Paucilactobacillus wasatchensis]|uniref:UvrABC system protein A n=1 Tax=Paucilactobacillus wasatchensis TaxID=1335616 RepID=A0A0D1A7J3_9LACO|nr:excinuclease ABC subunit UvrA [Paucilactobacillus wasatchensis]KIS02691.1 Excinuclease ABC subunit A like protein [Paucilactobacillus wasatchensis]
MSVQHRETIPENIEVIGAHVNNLKNLNVKIPLNAFVAITGRSGSGKSSLAMGVLYAEGARHYLDALSTYTRRRIGQVGKAEVDQVKYLPSALALRQRPTVPSVRSTVGTMTESLNVLRLIFSRLGSHQCPNGHQISPTLSVAENMGEVTCPVCHVKFTAFGAEDFAFNSHGACPDCNGTGQVRQIMADRLIPDQTKTIREGAVASWRLPGRNFMIYVAQQIGIPIDTPFNELSAAEQEQVWHGQKKQYAINIPSKTGKIFHMDNAQFENAFAAVEDSLATTTNERAILRLNRFYSFAVCPTCHGNRFKPELLTTKVADLNIAQVSQMTIGALKQFVPQILHWLPAQMQAIGKNLVGELKDSLQPILDLGLDYLTLDRAGETLSTGELQRIQLGRTLRSETTGVLYILDEPSIGLHPANVTGLVKVLRQLVNHGNSLVVVDHDTNIIAAADYVIEIGPQAGQRGGTIVDQGTVAQIKQAPQSLIAPFLTGTATLRVRPQITPQQLSASDRLQITVSDRYNLHDVTAQFIMRHLNVVSGYSGAGKSTLIMDSLIPGLKALNQGQSLPRHVASITANQINRVVTVDSVPVGKNVRSTVATYTGLLDELRKLFAQTKQAQQLNFGASHFSYNVKAGACPTCNGTGSISLDIQYLPDMIEECPTCHGNRYNNETLNVKWNEQSIADILSMDVNTAITVFESEPKIESILLKLQKMGLGYLHLGESTPVLSGGEAQRLKLVSHMGRNQTETLFVFDEPSVGLHPLDIQTLIKVFDQLLTQGATIIVIEHDLDILANADYIVDLGPKGGRQGGHIVGSGTPAELATNPNSETVTFLKRHLALFKQH